MFRNLPNDGQIEIYFETVSSTGAPVAPSSAFTASDFAIFKNGSATAKTSTNGLTVTSPFNSETGCHLLVIDTSVDTDDSGFWTTGARYHVKFNTAKTVDSLSIDGRSVPRGAFGIESEYMRGTDSAATAASITTLRGADSDTLKTLSDQIDGLGNATVNVLPATGIVADRSAGVTLSPVVGETISQAITLYQSDGTTAVNLSGKTLKIIFETMAGIDIAIVSSTDITISGTESNVVTFAYPSAVTSSDRTLRFAIRDAAAPLTMYLQGVCSVTAAPKVDA